MDPKEVRSSGDPRCMVIDCSASCRGGGSDSSAHKRVNPGWQWPLYWHQGRPSGVRPPLAQMSVMDPSLPMWGPKGLYQPHLASDDWTDHPSPLWEWGTCGAPALLHRAPPEASQNGQCIFGMLWPMLLSLQITLVDTLEFHWSLLGRVVPSTQQP